MVEAGDLIRMQCGAMQRKLVEVPEVPLSPSRFQSVQKALHNHTVLLKSTSTHVHCHRTPHSAKSALCHMNFLLTLPLGNHIAHIVFMDKHQ